MCHAVPWKESISSEHHGPAAVRPLTSTCLTTGLAMLMVTTITLASTPCPWQGSENSPTCQRWQTLAQDLASATQPAQAAVDHLHSLANTAPSAQAEPSEPERAQVKTVIGRLLETYALPLPESSRIDFDPNYTVLKENAGFSAYLPKIAWIKGSTKVDFGPVTVHIQPREQGLVTVNFSIGDVITLWENDSVLARILTGEQENQGIWDDALENFNLLTWRLGRVNLIVTDTPVSLTLNGISLNQTLSRNPEGSWTQRQALELADLTLQLQEDTLSIDRIIGQFGLDGMDYGKWLSLRRDLSPTVTHNDAETTQHFLSYLDGIGSIFNRFDAKLHATNLTLSKTKGPLTTIKRISLGSGFNQEQGSSFILEVDLSDLDTQSPAMPTDLSPVSIRLDMSLSNIPPKLLWQIMRASLASEQLPEDEQEDYLDKAFATMLMNSKLALDLRDSFVSTPEARLDFKADAAIDPKAAFSAIGNFYLQIEGMDKALERFAGLIDQSTAGRLLAILIALSNRTQNAGKTIDSFVLKLTEEGKLLLNGKDVTGLFISPYAG